MKSLTHYINEERSVKEYDGAKSIHDDEKSVGELLYLQLFKEYVLKYNHDWTETKDGKKVIFPKGMKKEKFVNKELALQFAKDNNIEIVKDGTVRHQLAFGLPDTRSIRA